MKFTKYHALGNDYLVLDPNEQELTTAPAIEQIKTFVTGATASVRTESSTDRCHPKRRVSLFAYSIQMEARRKKAVTACGFSVAICGTEKRSTTDPLLLRQKAAFQARVLNSGKRVRVEMDRVSFQREDIPISGSAREVLDEQITVEDRTFQFCGATIGNPHCVILYDEPSPDLAKRYGPLLEVHPFFPNRTNVQFMKILDRNNIRIEIWERGAGYTLTSGSSSCASAATAFKLGLCDHEITFHMPGGKIEISVDDTFQVTMTGPVARVAEGELSEEIFANMKLN
jgi:diaminopimelate epimerase